MMKTLGTISSRGGTGKSVISTNLAATLSKRDYSTVLIETDFIAPNLAYLLNLEQNDKTWNDYLLGDSSIDEMIHTIEVGDDKELDVITTKINNKEILDLLNAPEKWRKFSDRIVDFLSQIEEERAYDYVIFDNQSGRFLSTITHTFFSDFLICVLRPDITNVRDTLEFLQLYKNDVYLIWNQLLEFEDIEQHISNWEEEFNEMDNYKGTLGKIPLDQHAAYQKWIENETFIQDTDLNSHLEKICDKLESL